MLVDQPSASRAQQLAHSAKSIETIAQGIQCCHWTLELTGPARIGILPAHSKVHDAIPALPGPGAGIRSIVRID